MLRSLVAFALFALFLGACAAPQTSRLVANASDLPRRGEVGGVPFYPQEDNYCGPAALAMVASWAGVPLTQEQAAEQVYTPGKIGTLRNDIIAAARRNGLLAVQLDTMDELITEVAAGHPVVVFQNLGLNWAPVWHYAVAHGYDLDKQTMLLHSGVTARRITDMHAFERTWQRGEYWALVVLPPDLIPVTASEEAVLQGAVGLERAERTAEALRAYKAAVQRWPTSFGAWFGLGNAEYAAGDFAASAIAFQRAADLQPSQPAPWNNLAYALAGLNRFGEARAAAERAVAVAPADAAAPYRETLAEIVTLAR